MVSPAGVLPQRADRLDPDLPLGDDELAIDVDALNIDSASFKQISDAVGRDPARIGEEVARIVRERGKMHNPVTGSGGMLIGRVREVGPRHPAAGDLAVGDRIATLVSLTLTPLRIDELLAVHPEIDRVDVRGSAILFATGLWARLPGDLPDALALAALDVCGAPALVARHARPGARVLVIGRRQVGRAGLRAGQGDAGRVGRGGGGRPLREGARRPRRPSAWCDRTLSLDATRGVDALQRVESAGGLFDLVVNCANVPGTELSTLLLVRDGGTVIFFSMATSFTAAALGAEGVGKDATLLIGNGYVPGHADLALGLLRRKPEAAGALRGAIRIDFQDDHERPPDTARGRDPLDRDPRERPGRVHLRRACRGLVALRRRLPDQHGLAGGDRRELHGFHPPPARPRGHARTAVFHRGLRQYRFGLLKSGAARRASPAPRPGPGRARS